MSRFDMVPLRNVVAASGYRARGLGDLPVYSVTKHQGFVPSLEYFKKQVYSRDLSGYTVVEPGEFAYATIHLDEGSIGIANTRCLISPMYTVFRLASTEVHAPYLLRYLKSQRALAEYPRLGKGSVHRRKSISLNALGDLHVPLPPISEQRRIADLLDRADELRAKRREALAHLDALTQSLFLDMFGDPVSNPKKWPVKKLMDLGALERGVSTHRPRNEPALLGGSYPLIQTGDVANSGGYIRRYNSTYSELGLRQSRMWPSGTLCITIAANIAKTGILTFDACFPDSVVGFTASPATTLYVQSWLSFLQESLERTAPESAQKNINLAILRNLPTICPPTELIETFATNVAAIERLRALQRASLDELDALFASLQDRAFRGLL